jgi:hypothetical protein
MSKVIYLFTNGDKVTVSSEFDTMSVENFPKLQFEDDNYPFIVAEYDNKDDLIRSYEYSSPLVEDNLKSVERVTSHNIDMEKLFQKYYQHWDKETCVMSSSVMFDNVYYQAIIALGWKVVPYIIEQLRKQPCHLFKALKQITGINPAKPEHIGRIPEMAKDWIEWYDKEYVKEYLL